MKFFLQSLVCAIILTIIDMYLTQNRLGALPRIPLSEDNFVLGCFVSFVTSFVFSLIIVYCLKRKK